MPKGTREPVAVKARYFRLIRTGMKGAAAARLVGVSTSCRSLWYIEAGSMAPDDKPVTSRFLTQDDRIAIAEALADGVPVAQIAEQLGKHRSTIYREIERGRTNTRHHADTYHPWWSHNQVLLRRKRPKTAKLAGVSPLKAAVVEKLKEGWSPQQISRHLARRYPRNAAMRACPETIYRALYAGHLGSRERKLRTGRTRRRRQRRGVPHKNRIPNMRPVHSRPTEANERRAPGHWEGDLIIGRGQRSAVGTLVDRATRFVHLIHLPGGWKAPQLRDALAAQFGTLPRDLLRTLTWDQGRELYHHEQVTELIGLQIYFCDPHAPWQRPANENTVSLVLAC